MRLSQKLTGLFLMGAGATLLAMQQARAKRRISLNGKVVLITGGSRGLGLALAREFIGHGAKVAICARDREELEAAKENLKGSGVNVETFVCDVRDAKAIARVIDDVEARLGGIDVLVNNAGIITVGPTENMSSEEIADSMATNFWPAVHTIFAMRERMKARGGGRIVNIGSVGGKMPVPHLAGYCASKFALAGFSGAIRGELVGDGIYVTCVNPGLMRTGSPRNAKFAGKAEAEYAWFSASDNLPGLSMSAAGAARRIVQATIHGDAEVTLGLPAKLGARSYGLMPAVHIEAASLVSRLLPSASSGSNAVKAGRESESWFTKLFQKPFTRTLEARYNQLQQ